MKNLTYNILDKQIKSVISDIKKVLSDHNPKLLLIRDSRSKLFIIEGILRIHIKYPKSKLSINELKLLEDFLYYVKMLEDQIGKFSLNNELKEYAEKKSLKKSLIKEINNVQKSEDFEMVTFIQKNDYILSLPKYLKQISDISLLNKKKKINQALKYEIKRIDLKIKENLEPSILIDKYNYMELENGLHEWRRMIRWVSIYIQAYKCIFTLKKTKNSSYKELIEEQKSSKFSKLSTNKKSTKINDIAYYQLSKFISDIGKIKTEMEIVYFLENKFKYKQKNKQRIEKLAHIQYQNFKSLKVLKKIRKCL